MDIRAAGCTLTLSDKEATLLQDLLGSIGGYGDGHDDLLFNTTQHSATELREELINPLHALLSQL